MITKGDELMLFYNGKSIAYATAHTLTLASDTIDIANKDLGYWGASEVGKLTWEVTSDNLYSPDGFDALYDIYAGKTPVEIVFGHAGNYNIGGLDAVVGENNDAWVPDTENILKGKAVISNLTVNANTGENATFSATFTGCSALTKA